MLPRSRKGTPDFATRGSECETIRRSWGTGRLCHSQGISNEEGTISWQADNWRRFHFLIDDQVIHPLETTIWHLPLGVKLLSEAKLLDSCAKCCKYPWHDLWPEIKYRPIHSPTPSCLTLEPGHWKSRIRTSLSLLASCLFRTPYNASN